MLQNSKPQASWYERVLLIAIMTAPCFFIRFSLDNDAYWLIASGRYVIQHGIPYTDPLSMHVGLDFVMQQWLSAVCFATIYDSLGILGIIMLVITLFVAMALLVHRLCVLISCNEFISYVVTILTVVVLWPFMTSRPFLISLFLFLIEIYCLEKTIITKKKAWLIGIPVLSIALVNFHAALWPFLFVIGIPYLLDSVNFNWLLFHGEGYPRLRIMIAFVVAFIVGFINPYGFKSMSYLFRSYGHQSISKNVLEMQSPNFQTGSGIFVFMVLLLVVTILIVAKPQKLKLRYGLLLLGTGFMALTSLRNLSLFAICGMPMLAYAMRDVTPNLSMSSRISLKKQFILLITYVIVVLMLFAVNLSNARSDQFSGLPKDAVRYIQKTYGDEENLRLFADYNWGGYAEFSGLKPFIDARAEVFLKENNGKADIFVDLLAVDSGKLYYNDFINRYNLNVFLIEKGELLEVYLGRDKEFSLVYQDDTFVVYEKNKW